MLCHNWYERVFIDHGYWKFVLGRLLGRMWVGLGFGFLSLLFHGQGWTFLKGWGLVQGLPSSNRGKGKERNPKPGLGGN